MLKGVFGDFMPYNDPHTAGSALWSLLRDTQVPSAVSTCSVYGDDAWRKRASSNDRAKVRAGFLPVILQSSNTRQPRHTGEGSRDRL